VQLLIMDDWGLEPLKPAHRNDLMEIMDDAPRFARRANDLRNRLTDPERRGKRSGGLDTPS